MVDVENPTQKLLHAAKKGNLDLVQRLLTEGHVHVSAHESGRTALHFASMEGHIEVVKYLIEAGADVNAKTQLNPSLPDGWCFLKDTDSVTPLHLAVLRGSTAIAALLLQAGADIASVYYDGSHKSDALATAAWERNPELVQLLIDHGAYTAGLTPPQLRLRTAIMDGNEDALSIAMQQDGLNINARCFSIYDERLELKDRTARNEGAGNCFDPIISEATALHLAIYSGHSSILDMILKHPEVDIEAKSPDVEDAVPPLHLAVRLGEVEAVRKLIEAGANIELQVKCWQSDSSYDHITPLSLAIASKKLDVARLLLERGADPNAECSEYVPLCYAVAWGAEYVNVLIEHGADPNHAKFSNDGPWYCALQVGPVESVAALLKAGLSIGNMNILNDTDYFSWNDIMDYNAKLILLLEMGMPFFAEEEPAEGVPFRLYKHLDAIIEQSVQNPNCHLILKFFMEKCAAIGRCFVKDFKAQFTFSVLEVALLRVSKDIPLDVLKFLVLVLDVGDRCTYVAEEKKALVAVLNRFREEKYEALSVLFPRLEQEVQEWIRTALLSLQRRLDVSEEVRLQIVAKALLLELRC